MATKNHNNPPMEDLLFLYNDAEIFAVYKPASLHSVRIPSEGGHSLADDLLNLDPCLLHASRSELDAGLVQRLDYGTSGVILGAKNRASWDALYSALSEGLIKKSYVALIEGELKQELTVTNFIGSPHRGAKRMKVYSMPPSPPVRALPAQTTFRPLKYLEGFKLTLVEAIASPARRHQVRAHAAYAGHPLIGDLLYGSKRSLGALCSQPRDLFLHAWKLAFKHPKTGEEVRIESDFHPELSSRSGIIRG